MAVDEAIAESAGKGDSPPTLRLYSWEPPCLSLGYAQPAADVEVDALAGYGWDLVRRPTGGRAILHTDELTYSITGPKDEPRLAGGVLESYRKLAGALLQGLHLMGLPAQSHPKPDAPRSISDDEEINPVCFEVPSHYEITVQGKKLIGSAQARRQGWILQHGSLPLSGDLSRIVQVLVFKSKLERKEAASRLLDHAATAASILGRSPSFDEVAAAFIQAFEETLNIKLDLEDLSREEIARVRQLLVEKYANDGWTKRV